jgi:hypothetical protein
MPQQQQRLYSIHQRISSFSNLNAIFLYYMSMLFLIQTMHNVFDLKKVTLICEHLNADIKEIENLSIMRDNEEKLPNASI